MAYDTSQAGAADAAKLKEELLEKIVNVEKQSGQDSGKK